MKRLLGAGLFGSIGGFAGAAGRISVHPLREETRSCKSETGLTQSANVSNGNTKAKRIGVYGNPISQNEPGAPCARTTAPLARPGKTSTMTRRALESTAGMKMAWA